MDMRSGLLLDVVVVATWRSLGGTACAGELGVGARLARFRDLRLAVCCLHG